MKALLVVCAFVGIYSTLAAADPNKPVWPPAFDCPFGLNVVPTNTSPPIINQLAHFYYQWTNLKASLVDYPQGCLPFFFPGANKFPCKLYFLPNGTYLSLPKGGPIDCCLVFPGVGSIPPDFLTPFNYSGYQTLAMDGSGVTHMTDFWVAVDGFQYWTDSTTGFDIQFADAGLLLWNFGDFNVQTQPSSLFELPKPSCNNLCPGTGTSMMQPDLLMSLSMLHHGMKK